MGTRTGCHPLPDYRRHGFGCVVKLRKQAGWSLPLEARVSRARMDLDHFGLCVDARHVLTLD
jgi:hypothetical protein